MTDERLAVLLHDAAADVDVPPAPTDRILAAGRRRLRRRRAAELAGTVAAVTAVAVLVPLGITARSAAPAGPPAVPCSTLQRAVLPEWARTGFSEAEPVMQFVLGDREEMVAILFGESLLAPPPPGQQNKVLLVARGDFPPGPLVITARPVDAPGEAVVIENAAGPGPSTVDLPTPGCWELELRWADRVDTLDLRYVPPS